MAGEDNRLVEKIAFCSVLCAGFAYAGYNVVSKMCHRKPEPKENRFSQTVITGFIDYLCINCFSLLLTKFFSIYFFI